MFAHPHLKVLGAQISHGSGDLSSFLQRNRSSADLESILTCFKQYLIETATRKTVVAPNFQIELPLPPSGIVSEYDGFENSVAHSLTCHFYRVITMVEISSLFGTEWKDLDSLKQKQEVIRKVIPLRSSCPPKLMLDNATTGWCPELGDKGSIGLFSLDINNIEGGDKETRHFIICHSGLPLQLVDEVCKYNFDINISNRKIEAENELMSMSASNLKFDTQERISNYQHFGKGSLQQICRGIAFENGRRLCQIFADALDLSFKDQEPFKYFADPVDRQLGMYPESGNDDISLLKEALAFFPKNTMIFPYTQIPNPDMLENELQYSNNKKWTPEALELKKKEKLFGYNIGKVLHEYKNLIEILKKKTERNADENAQIQQFETLVMEHKILFQNAPLSIKPFCETEYNTFRIERDESIIWYNGCAPINMPTPLDYHAELDGVLVQKPFALGYWLVENSHFSTALGEWTNQALNSFPVLFPFEHDPRFQFQNLDDSHIFFSFKNGGITNTSNSYQTTPKFVQGWFRNIEQLDKNGKLRMELYGNRYNPDFENKKDLEPIFVYVSLECFDNYSFI